MKKSMEYHPVRERGNTFIGFLLKMMLFGFFVLLALKIGPIYLEHYKIVQSLESLESDKDLANRTREEIMTLLMKRWDINGVEAVNKQNVTITKDIDGVQVRVSYEATQHIMANIDVIAKFDDVIEVSNH